MEKNISHYYRLFSFQLYEAYIFEDHMILILEKLYGQNVARSLSLKNKYNEYQVSAIIKQV